MRILYLYDGDWPKGATRVAKETKSLAGAGHEVTLVSRNETRRERVHADGWMTVHRLPAFGPGWLTRFINFPYFFNPVWIWQIHASARRTDADCIIVADLPLALTALFVGKMLGLPVYYDMAEVYPEFLRGLWEFDDMSWSDHLVRNPEFADAVERIALPQMEATFVVSEESRDRCIRMGVDPDDLVIVGNTPEDPDAMYAPGALIPELEPWADRPVLLFVGILIGDRGVGTAIEAMPALIEEIPDAALLVVGDGPDRPRLERLVQEHGLQDHVTLLGWKQHEDLPAYYAVGDVGLLPFHDGSHVRITLANKLFDYMAAGLPVIGSDLPPMRRVVEECGSGLLVPPADAAGLAAAAARMLADPDGTRAMAESGRQAILSHYCWREDERRMLEALEARHPALVPA